MSMLMLLRDDAQSLSIDAVAGALGQIADLGVTEVTVLRDGARVAVVLQGWLLDPTLERAAVRLLTPSGGSGQVQILRPVVQLAVNPTGGGSS